MNTVTKSYDIVVLGAGPGGLAAALQAARNGAKVLLADKNGCLGGNMTLGLPPTASPRRSICIARCTTP